MCVNKMGEGIKIGSVDVHSAKFRSSIHNYFFICKTLSSNFKTQLKVSPSLLNSIVDNVFLSLNFKLMFNINHSLIRRER